MFFPVLPIRLNEKLMFVLCFECAKSKNHNEICNHSEKQKSLFGTWCLHEIYEALKHGYKIRETYELIY